MDSRTSDILARFFLSPSLQEKPYMVKMRAEDALRDVVRTMVEEHVHRVYIVDDEGRPTGLVTPTGVLVLIW